MTTIVLDAYKVTSETTTNNGQTTTTQIGFDQVSLEFVIGLESDGFTWTAGDINNPTVVTPNGGVGVVYEVRIDGQIVDLDTFVETGVRINWDTNQTKSTDAFAFGYDDPASSPTESTSLLMQMGGDFFDINSLSEYQAWLQNVTSGAITDGAYAPGQNILYSSLMDFASSSENDMVTGDPDVATTYRLGAGDDTFVGSSANEKVYSGVGADDIDLGAGNDYVLVGGGVESFDGGAGNDYISYYNSTNGITANLATNTVSGSWAVNDTIANFESMSGSKNGGDNITGTSGANTIRTYGGNDKVYAGAGADKVELGAGNDYVLVGGGVESFDGGSGSDYISYYNSSNGITINLGQNTVTGSWAINDTITGFESVSGSKTGNDLLIGSTAANTMRGYGGDDKFYGGSGSDKLYGGDGNDFFDGGGGTGTDQMWGGAGNDVFQFDRGEGVDIIRDFEDDIDTIELDNFSFDEATAFTFASESGGDVIFDFGTDGMLTVENMTIAQLQDDLMMV